MALGKTVDAILAEAEQIVRVWEANPDFSMGDIKLADFKAMIADLRTNRNTLDETRTKVTQLVNAQHDKGKALRRLTTRARGGFRATYGPNSSQYEQSGGTREDERKPRKAGGSKKSSS
jgi:hypothetical protein